MRKLKVACLNTEEAGDRFRLIPNERWRRDRATGQESGNKAGPREAEQGRSMRMGTRQVQENENKAGPCARIWQVSRGVCEGNMVSGMGEGQCPCHCAQDGTGQDRTCHGGRHKLWLQLGKH